MTQGLDLLPTGDLLVHADLAEQALEGLLRAPKYVSTDAAHAAVATAAVTGENGQAAGQLLYGEAFDILFRRAGRAYGRTRRDGVVGWVLEAHLKPGAPSPVYRVSVLDAALPFNALVQGDEGLEASQMLPAGQFEVDLIAVAQGFAGVAYEAGARGSRSVDGIGFVQQALFACGLPAPRLASELAKLGRAISVADAQSGDLVIWSHANDAHIAHAAVMIDAHHIIHASELAGKVITEQLADVAAGLGEKGFAAPKLRRLSL